AELLHEAEAAVDRNRGVFEAVENRRRWKSRGNVCCCRSRPTVFIAGSSGHHVAWNRSRRIVRQTNSTLRTHAWIATGSLKLRPFACTRREQRVIAAGGITDNADPRGLDAESFRV